LDELSMNAPVIPWVKKIVRAMTASEAKKLLRDVMAFSTAAEIEGCVREHMAELFPDEFVR
ncbi:MAG TPA: hypothetical protein DEA95_05330, partial [Nitrospiraceae bacterium]|nr:hypothetical protein [Nitrospiraceae bacterium]